MFGIIGAISQANSQNAAAARQYAYDKKVYKYQWNETKADYQWQLNNNNIARTNQDNNLRFQEQTAIRDYQDRLRIREFDYANQVRQYNESERIYGLQLGFNNQAAQIAQEAETRRYQEILTGMAFDQQDMLVKMLQEEGQLQAVGVSGRSATKALASAMASYGRNQAVMAESLVSATTESNANRRQINLEKYGADLAAESKRMLVPLKAPAPSAPLKMPRATIQDPRKPVKPPKPIKGAGANVFSSAMGGLANDIGLGLSIAGLF